MKKAISKDMKIAGIIVIVVIAIIGVLVVNHNARERRETQLQLAASYNQRAKDESALSKEIDTLISQLKRLDDLSVEMRSHQGATTQRGREAFSSAADKVLAQQTSILERVQRMNKDYKSFSYTYHTGVSASSAITELEKLQLKALENSVDYAERAKKIIEDVNK